MKYHVNPESGKVGQCSATIKCKFAKDGQIPKHFDGKDEAKKAVENVLSREFGNTQSLTKNSTSQGIQAPEDWDSNDYDNEGFDREGYDVDGFDREGYSIEGYDQNGFDKDGFDEDGFSNKGDFADTNEVSQKLADESKETNIPPKPKNLPTVHKENIPPKPTQPPTVGNENIPPKPKKAPTAHYRLR